MAQDRWQEYKRKEWVIDRMDNGNRRQVASDRLHRYRKAPEQRGHRTGSGGEAEPERRKKSMNEQEAEARRRREEPARETLIKYRELR